MELQVAQPNPHRREFVALFLALFSLAGGLVWIRTATVKDTYRFVQLEREYRKLQQEIQAARVRWLKLTSPKRLEGMALALGLVPPRPSQILRYEPEKNHPAIP